jgi:hypothetical protein
MVPLFPGCVIPSNEATRWLGLHYPGQTWIIDKEPDVIWQDALTGGEYAHTYHDLYHLIKTADPQA